MEDTVTCQFVLDCLQTYLQVCILLLLSHVSLNSLVVHLLAWLRIFVQKRVKRVAGFDAL